MCEQLKNLSEKKKQEKRIEINEFENLTYELDELDKELKYNLDNFHKQKKKCFTFNKPVIL